MVIETRITRRHVTPRYKNLRGAAAVDEYVLDLFFEVIYAHRPKQRGRKPVKAIKALITKGRMGALGSKDNLDILQDKLFAEVRGKENTSDLNRLISSYLHRC